MYDFDLQRDNIYANQKNEQLDKKQLFNFTIDRPLFHM